MTSLKLKLVLKNGVINFVLQVFPVLSALICVPLLVKAWGKDVFGIYSLVSTMILLYSYLNFGIGPGVCKKVADAIARKDHREANRIITLGMATMIVLGVFWSLFFFAGSRFLTERFLRLSPEQIKMTVDAFRQVFFLSPVIFMVILLRSVFEAYQVFVLSGSIRAFLNSAIFLTPLPFLKATDPMSKSLKMLTVCYIGAMVLYLAILIRRKGFRFTAFRRSDLGDLYGLSIWLAITAIFAAALYYVDRYLIGALLGMTMVAYYVAAYDLITRVSLVSGSMTQSFFPAAAYWKASNDHASLVKAYKVLSGVLFVVMLFICSSALIFAKDFLGIWMGKEFAIHAGLTLKILCLGVFFNAMAAVPLRFLGSTGFEKTAPRLYAVLLVPHIVLNILAIPVIGIEAAAGVYSLRALVEFAYLSYVLLKKTVRISIPSSRLGIGAVLTGGFFFLNGLISRLSFGPAKIGIYFLIIVIPFGWVVLKYGKRIRASLEGPAEAGPGRQEDFI